MNVVLLGAPGSGKGTYASRVSQRLGIPTVSTGEMLRQAIRSSTGVGREVEQYVSQGKLVPDEVMGKVLNDRLDHADCRPGFILDGYPRTLPQAEALDRHLESRGAALDLAVNIDVPESLVVRRLGGRRSCPSCGAVYNIHTLKPAREGVCDTCGTELVTRKDDEPETVRRRLRVYHEQSEPLVARYRERGILKGVDGGLPLEVVVDSLAALASGAPAP